MKLIFLFIFLNFCYGVYAVEYVILTNTSTFRDDNWIEVIKQAKKLHNADVLSFNRSPFEQITALKQKDPYYVTVITKPEYATRELVWDMHKLSRKLDNDIYGDFLWGIITGYNAEDASKLLKFANKTIKIENALTGCRIDYPYCKSWCGYSETQKGIMWKYEDGILDTLNCNEDTTFDLVDNLNSNKYQLFVTSGHATQNNWQIGYSYPNGQFISSNGQLFGQNLLGKRKKINSTNPKIYHAPGNCLIGEINSLDCMVLAWFHSAGVLQMCGYTVPTWFGFMGHGITTYFINYAGQYSYSESFFANNQALLHRLSLFSEFDFNINYDKELDDYYNFDSYCQDNNYSDKELKGLIWDRDVVAFYGDPSFNAKLISQKSDVDIEIKEEDDYFSVKIKLLKSKKLKRPPIIIFPRKIHNPKLEFVKGDLTKYVLTELFLLLETNETNQEYEIKISSKDNIKK